MRRPWAKVHERTSPLTADTPRLCVRLDLPADRLSSRLGGAPLWALWGRDHASIASAAVPVHLVPPLGPFQGVFDDPCNCDYVFGSNDGEALEHIAQAGRATNGERSCARLPTRRVSHVGSHSRKGV